MFGGGYPRAPPLLYESLITIALLCYYYAITMSLLCYYYGIPGFLPIPESCSAHSHRTFSGQCQHVLSGQFSTLSDQINTSSTMTTAHATDHATGHFVSVSM